MKRQIIILCLLFNLYFNAVCALNNIKFINYAVENGLTNNEVNAFYQDKNGFIWIGTADGLCKFDGYSFTPYYFNINDSSSLSNNLVKAIKTDYDGNLWIGTQNGLNKFLIDKNAFERYSTVNSQINFDITDLELDIDSSLIIASAFGLQKYNKKTNSLEPYFPTTLNSYGRDNTVAALEITKTGNLIIGMMWQGIFYYNRATKILKHYIPDNSNPNSISSNEVRSLAIDKSGKIWVGNFWQGLDLFDPDHEKFYHYKHDPQNSNSLVDNNIFTLSCDNNGNIIIGTESGLDIFNTKSQQFSLLQNDENVKNSLFENKIRSIFQDIQGNLWIGHLTKGISFSTYGYSKGFVHINKNPFDENSLSSNIVSAIIEDKNGDFWFGTDGGGLNSYIKRSNTWKHFKNDPKDKTSIGHDAVLSIFEDSDGNIWIGSFRGGLGLYNKTTGKFTNFKNDPNDPTSIAGDDVRFITEDKNKNLWIAAHGKALCKFNKETRKFTNFTVNDPDPRKRILNEWIWPLLIVDNLLWVGTVEGLFTFDINTETVQKTFTKQGVGKKVLSSNRIQCLFYDSDGNMWIGTEGGLNMFNKTDSTFTIYTKNNGLPNDIIKAILEDDNKNLWISTNKGISKFNLNDRTFKNYDSFDGLQGDIFFPRSAFKTLTGELMFGGMNGYNIFKPDEIKDNEFLPNVVITNFKLFNKNVEIGGKKSPLKTNISITKKIRLRHKQNVMTFEFVALNFIQPEKNQYAYYMEGFETNWNNVGNKREATYTNLNPGDYVFHVKASNNDGKWNEKGASIEVEIIPPFWKTVWFYLLIFVVLAGIVLAIIRLVRYNNQQEKKLLQAEIKKAVDEVEEKKQEIEFQNQALLQKQAEDEIRNWASVGMNKFADLLRENSDDLELFCNKIISKLAEFTEANLGAIFIRNDEDEKKIVYELRGAVAYGHKKILSRSFLITEGLIGACAFDKKTMYYSEIPEDYVKIASGMGEASPKGLLIVPCIFNQVVYGVIELASLGEIEEHKIKFVEELGEKIASTISIVQNNERTSKLLEQSRQQADELITSEEELRQNLEEMRATQEQSERREQDLLGEIDQIKKEVTKLKTKLRESSTGK